MKMLFEGLHIYEIVLLGLGILFFLVLLAILVFFVIKSKKISSLLLFFPIPIIMIGYPSIQGIEFAKDRLVIIKSAEELLENPADSVAKEETEERMAHFEKRAKTSEDFALLSKSNLLLGKDDKAITYAQKALAEDPNNQAAKELKTLASFHKKIANEDTITDQQLKSIKVSPELRPVKTYLKRQHQIERRKTSAKQ